MANGNGGVRSTTVKYTGSGKPFGVDIFVSVETIHEWPDIVDDDTALARQAELSEQLTLQVTDLIKAAASKVKEEIALTPKGQASVHPVQPNQFAGTQAGTQAPQGNGQAAVVAVANGASDLGNGWMSVPSRFGDGQVRFVTSAVYSSDQLKADVANWIAGNGINPNYFDVWDERVGPRGAESGAQIGSVFNIKVKKDYQELVPNKFHRNAAGRGKFNNDGSIYPYWSKEFIDFLDEYGGRDKLANTTSNPF